MKLKFAITMVIRLPDTLMGKIAIIMKWQNVSFTKMFDSIMPVSYFWLWCLKHCRALEVEYEYGCSKDPGRSKQLVDKSLSY